MTSQEIYTIANEMTEKEADNIIGGWERDNESDVLKTYNSLVKLGDSKQLAVATAMADKYNKKDNEEFYSKAYRGY